MAVEDKSIKSITQGYLQLQGAETEDLKSFNATNKYA
jgi:hypothetical protein